MADNTTGEIETVRAGEYTYVRCRKEDVPADARFHVPRHLQGQIVERAFGVFGCGEGCAGDPYMRIRDRSDPRDERYYKLQKEPAK
jgi:hypothetical protein